LLSPGNFAMGPSIELCKPHTPLTNDTANAAGMAVLSQNSYSHPQWHDELSYFCYWINKGPLTLPLVNWFDSSTADQLSKIYLQW